MSETDETGETGETDTAGKAETAGETGDVRDVEDALFAAARRGDAATLRTLLDAHPDALQARAQPYAWTLLHTAAHGGHLAAVDLLLARGLDVNSREDGDRTYAVHWAAAAGSLPVVQRLADAGADLVGHGDDHELEVIGWATCWDDGDDEAHRAVAKFLVSRGARHHIFSAIALTLADDVRAIVARDPSALVRRQSRHENHRTPLQFAVSKNRPEMIALLLDLGADPLAVDGFGLPVAAYATAPDADRLVMSRIRALTMAEIDSAARGQRAPRVGPQDLLALLALGDPADRDIAARLVRDRPDLLDARGGVLHLMAKRGDTAAVRWLLDRGADPNGRWAHWDAELTPLHLAASQGHADIVRLLLSAGADPTIRDSKHDGDARGWADSFRHPAIVRLLDDHAHRE